MDMGSDVVVHLSCRDRSRASLESVAFGLASEGLTNVLALSAATTPRKALAVCSRPVFDIDSVGLLAMLRALSDRRPRFTAGAAREPLQERRADLDPQLQKLALKVACRCRLCHHPGRLGPAFMVGAARWCAQASDRRRHSSRASTSSAAVARVSSTPMACQVSA